MSVTLKQISPEKDQNLMGLEAYGYSVFPGCSTGFEIPMVNGKYNIGLLDKKDQDKRKRFEGFFGVEFDSERGRDFLSKYEVQIKHDVESFNENSIKDEFDLHVLRFNNGMGIVAVDENVYEEVPVNNFKFKLTDENKDIENKVTKKMITTEAVTKLGELFKSTSNRIVLIAKYIYPAGSGIANKNLAFQKIDEFITKNTNNAARFLDIVTLEPEYLDTVVKVKDAIFRGIIRLGNDGRYQLAMTGTILGRSEEEVITYCLNPANQDIVGIGTKDDKPSSLTSQLKEK